MSTLLGDAAVAGSPPQRRRSLGAGGGRARRLLGTAPQPVAAICALAWAVMVVAEVTGVSRYLHHDAVLGGATPPWAGLGLFLLGWLVMVAAMRLPGALPALSRPQSRAGESSPAVLAALLGGFALVWAVVGAVVLSLDMAVHQVVHDLPSLATRPWLVTVALLGVAGALQLAPSDRSRLAATRRLNTVADRPAEAFRAGRDHGARCLYADGPVMLVMFAVGGGFGWMALLTGVMTAERSSRAGAQVAVVTGVALLSGAALVALNPSWALGGAGQ